MLSLLPPLWPLPGIEGRGGNLLLRDLQHPEAACVPGRGTLCISKPATATHVLLHLQQQNLSPLGGKGSGLLRVHGIRLGPCEYPDSSPPLKTLYLFPPAESPVAYPQGPGTRAWTSLGGALFCLPRSWLPQASCVFSGISSPAVGAHSGTFFTAAKPWGRIPFPAPITLTLYTQLTATEPFPFPW